METILALCVLAVIVLGYLVAEWITAKGLWFELIVGLLLIGLWFPLVVIVIPVWVVDVARTMTKEKKDVESWKERGVRGQG